MGMHDGYLDRMAARMADLERDLLGASLEHLDASRRRDLDAGLAAAKERLQNLRRAGAEVSDEMIQSFTRSFERLRAAIGEARARAA
jgi:CHAD domain-containing protein